MNHPTTMPEADIYNAVCPSRQVLNRIGDKWSVMLLSSLAEQPVRFGELKRMCDGISQKMLTQTLRNLERDGVIHRRELSQKPLRVEYTLSPLGAELLTLLNPIIEWVHGHCEQILQSHIHYDKEH